MGEQRQRYDDEFKRQTVEYIQKQTKTMPEIAEELNIPVQTLHNWKANAEKIRELERLLEEKERELADTKEELAIVKKAVHIFSKPRN